MSHFTSLHHIIFPHSSQQFCNITTFLVIHNHHQVARWASFAFIFLTDVQLLRNEVLKKWSKYNYLCWFFKFHSSHHATVQCNNSCSNMINATIKQKCSQWHAELGGDVSPITLFPEKLVLFPLSLSDNRSDL